MNNEKINTRDLILLSSYLDGELNPREKTRVEHLLKERPAYCATLESLRHTSNALRHAPKYRVPHNFTLKPEMVKKQNPAYWRFVPAMRLSSVVAAVISLVLISTQFLPRLSMAVPMAAAPEAAMDLQTADSLPMEAPAAQVESTLPPVVYWGGAPTPFAGGMGGGGDDTIPDGYGAGGMAMMEPIVQPEEGLAKVFAPAENPSAVLLNPPVTSDSSVETEPLEGTGPILGIAPEEVQGTNLPDTDSARQATSEDEQIGGSRLPWQVSTALGLFGLALALLVTSFILKRKTLS